jgi:hypothetical protein
MNQEQRGERIESKLPPEAKNARENSRENKAGGNNLPPAAPSWLGNINDFVRRQPREYAVTRFG